jgi:soluble lytic murein transglycosylase-like protein
MQRYFPAVRALYEHVRRPANMMLIGLGLMAPAGALILGRSPTPPGETVSEAAPVQVDRGPAGGVDVQASVTPAAPAAEQAPAEAAAERAAPSASEDAGNHAAPVASEKAQPAAERPSAVNRLAREYGVPTTLAAQIHRSAVANGIEPRVAFGLVRTESSFRRNVVSHVGAVGYTQLLPSTARWMAPGTARSDLFHPQTNLQIGFKYLRYLVDKYDGNVRLALTAYNRGPGTVDKLLKQGRNPENGYATKVLSRNG